MSKKNDNNNNFFNQNPLITFIIFAIIVILAFKAISPQNGGSNINNSFMKTINISYSDLKNLIKSDKITYVGIGTHTIKAKSQDGSILITRKVPNDTTLVPLLDKNHIPYGAIKDTSWINELIFGWVIPIAIFFGIWMFLANRMQKSIGGGILGGSKKLISSEKPNVTFENVAGNDEAKEEVKEIVDFLKEPQRYLELGAKIPKGVLLVGPPGTGKTLLAKAVAGEADVPFFAVSGSSFIEMFVGVGASRVRDLFSQAKKEAPAIIFIDEIDAIGKSRAAGGMMGGNDEREQTLNQLLAEMDGFEGGVPVIVLAATNRPEVLDPALLRPGRFDRQVLVDKPDYKGRIEILKVHIKEYKLSKNVNLEDIAKMTAGLAGADLANIVNEAALLAGRQNKKEIEQSDFLEAIERAIAGLEKKSRRIDEKEKRIVCYHESGHALIAEVTEGAKKVKKVSVVPRGIAALGYTLNTPEENKYLMQKHELIAEIDTLLGGRAAEEVFIKEISTGASNDLERATDIIKGMVRMYGMSEVAGLMVLEKQNSQFLGGGISQKDYSEEMAQKTDEYIKSLLDERYQIVKAKLKEYSEVIENMVKDLQEKEVISGKRVRELIEEFKSKKLENLENKEGKNEEN
jgi:cell division protease FtsH